VSFDPGPVLFIGAIVMLGILVIVPLGWLFFISLQRVDTGAFTLANYVEAFSNSIYLRPIVNSIILAVSVATIAALLGTPLAWLIARTDMPGRKWVRALITAAFVTPSFLGAEAWILLAAPHSGWVNRAIASVMHTEHGPINIYSLGGAIFVMALYNVPYTFTFVASAAATSFADPGISTGLLQAKGAIYAALPALPSAIAMASAPSWKRSSSGAETLPPASVAWTCTGISFQNITRALAIILLPV